MPGKRTRPTFVCLSGEIPEGKVCPAGPDGCGYCIGRRCDNPIDPGQEQWKLVDGEVVWPDGGSAA